MTALAALVLALLGPAQVVQAQTEDGEGITDQDKAIHYSLYYEDFKNESYASALPNLRWVIQNAPTYPKNDDRNFERLVEVYEGLAESASDDGTTTAYLDSALVTFDNAIEVLEAQGADFDVQEWVLNKGRFIQTHADVLSDRVDEVPTLYLKAYELAPDNIDAYYVRFVIEDYVRKEQKQDAIDLMEEVEPLFQDNPDMVAFIAQMRNNLFRSPEERMAFLEDQIEKKPEDVEIANELFNIYLDLQYRGKAAQLGQRLLELDPTARTYQLLGKMHLEDAEAEEAFALYEKALELPGADANARDIYYNMGIAQEQMGRLANARSYYRKALEADPNFGRAYIAIGDLYATTVANCGSFEREDRAVYWLAVDYYQRAMSVDDAITNVARQKVNTYRKSFPDQEALFFKGWEAGQSYTVNYGCYSWINENTTVKSP